MPRATCLGLSDIRYSLFVSCLHEEAEGSREEEEQAGEGDPDHNRQGLQSSDGIEDGRACACPQHRCAAPVGFRV